MNAPSSYSKKSTMYRLHEKPKCLLYMYYNVSCRRQPEW